MRRVLISGITSHGYEERHVSASGEEDRGEVVLSNINFKVVLTRRFY